MPLATENEREIPDFNEAFAGGSYAYFIGISRYTNEGIPQLVSPANDIESLQTVLQQKHGFKVIPVLLPKDNAPAKSLPNPLLDATRQDLLDFVKNIRCEEDSRLIVYFACHGVAESITEGGNPEGFLLPSDAQLSVHNSYVSMSEIHAVLSALPCRHLLIILDCCYAGAFKWTEVKRSLGAEKPLNLYYQKYRQYITNKTRQVITSAAADQQASDYSNRDSGRRNSPFAKCLTDALESDKADYLSPGQKRGDGIITVTELGLYLRSNIEDTKQIPAVWNIGADTKGEFIFLNPEQQRRTLLLLDKNRPNPYKGLLAYTAEDRNIFFGRQRALETGSEGGAVYKGLIDVVKENSLVLVTGRSGSGKSSLVKAGILSSYDSSLVREIRPGPKPLIEHASVITELRNEKTKRCCLLVDQYEELITNCKDEGERSEFQQQLKEIAAHHTVILTLRSDFEIQFKSSPLIGDGCVCYRFAVPPFTREDIYDIVVGPANHQAMEYKALPVREGSDQDTADTAFINRIVNDAYTYPDSLPLLSLALSKLYEEKESDAQDNAEYLTEKTYNSFKGITGIIEEGAESVYRKYAGNENAVAMATREEMTAGQQLLMGLIFRMMSFEGGDITKRRVYTNRNEGNGPAYNELQFSDDATTEQFNRIKEDLIAARLLKADKDEAGNEYAEPAHEALLRSWPRLTQLLDRGDATGSTHREKTILLKQVSELARQYHLATRKDKKDILWVKDYRLQQVLQYKGNDFRLNEVEEAFISASEKERRRNKRIRNTWYTVGLTASLIAAVVFLYQYINIQKKNNEVQNQLAQSYWDEALSAGAQNKNNESLLYTSEALGKATDKDLREEMLISAGVTMPAIVLQNIITPGDNHLRYKLSNDGNTILIFSDSLLRLYDVVSGKQKYAPMLRHFSKAFFGSDDATILASTDTVIYIMDVSLHILDSIKSESGFTGMDIAIGKNTFITGTDTGIINIWQYGRGDIQQVKSFAGDYPASHFIVSPDGQRLFTEVSPEDAAYYGIYKCTLWDVATGEILYTLRTESSNITSAVNPSLTKIFTSADGYSEFFELGKGKKTIHNTTGAGFDAAVFVNGEDSLLLSIYDTISYWNFSKAQKEGDNHIISVDLQSDLVYSRAANYLLIGNTLTGRYYILDAHTLQTSAELINPDGIYPQVSADGTTITVQTNTSVYVYKYLPPAEQNLGNKTFDLFAFSPDGNLAATIDSKYDCEIWNLKDGVSLYKQPHRFSIRGETNVWRDKLFFSGGTVVLQSGSKSVLYDFNSGIEKSIDSSAFDFNPLSADGKRMVYALPDGTLHSREAPDWNDKRVDIHNNKVQQCYFIGSPQQMVVLKGDNKACLKKLGQPNETLLYDGGKEPVNLTVGATGNWCLLYEANGNGVLCSSSPEGNHIMPVHDLHFGNKDENTTGDDNDVSADDSSGSKDQALNFFISRNGKLLLQRLNDSFFVYHVETGARNLVKAVTFLDAADIADATIDETNQLLVLPYEGSINPQMTTAVIDLSSRQQKGPAFTTLSKDKKNSTGRVFHFNQSGQFVLHDVTTPLNNGSNEHDWYLYDYNRARAFAQLPSRYDSAFFLKEESIICGYHYDDNNKVHITATGFDLDISSSLFALQTAALTGERLNTVTGEAENIPQAEWRSLRQRYEFEAAEHYRQCKYKQFNTWAKLYPAEAAKYR